MSKKSKLDRTVLSVKFNFAKETPGTFVYSEVDEDGNILKPKDEGCVIGTLYIRKSSMQDVKKAPKKIRVRVTY